MSNQQPVPAIPSLQIQAFHSTDEQEVRDVVNAASAVCSAKFSTIALFDNYQQYNFYNSGFELSTIPINESLVYKLQQGNDVVIIENLASPKLLLNVSLGNVCPKIQFYAGLPLENSRGEVFGYLCIYNDGPLKITNTQRLLLNTLTSKLVTLFNHENLNSSSDLNLRHREEHLIRRESFFNNTKMVTLLLDKKFSVLKCHPLLSKLIGEHLDREIQVGDDIRDYIGERTMVDFVNNYHRALEGQSISVQTKFGLCWGGVNSYSQFSPAYGFDGELIGVSYHALPIFPENAGENISEQNDQRLQWINDLQSHRFRGPLSSILGITQIWKELGSTPLDEEIDMIIQAANKLDREIQSVLFNTTKRD